MRVDNTAIPHKKQHKPHPIRYKSYWRIMLVVLNLSLSNFYFGYALVYISTMKFEDTYRIFKVTFDMETARGILTGCIPIGAGIGAILGKKIIRLFSRRNFVIFINIMALVSGSLIFITEMGVFIVMRLIQGACIGLYTSIVPLMITQFSPVQMSGATGPLTQVFCSLGIAMAYLIFYIFRNIESVGYDQVWYYVYGFPLIPIIVQTIILIFVFPFNTPKYYLLNHQYQKAKDLIREFYKEEYVEQVYQHKVQDLQNGKLTKIINSTPNELNQNASNNNKVANESLDMIKASEIVQPVQIQKKESIRSIQQNPKLTKQQSIIQATTPRLAIFASLHINILRQFVGLNVVLIYGGNIIRDVVPSLRSLVPVILNFQAMFGAMLTMYLLGKVGRKTLLQVGTVTLAISLGLITLGFFLLESHAQASVVLILVGLFIYMGIFGATLGSVAWLYIAEIVEPTYIIYATTTTWVFASVVTVLFPIFKEMSPNQNPCYLFLFFFIWTSLSFFVNRIAFIETKGKTAHQIFEAYRNIEDNGIFTLRVKQQTQQSEIEIPKMQNEIANKLQNSNTKFQIKGQSLQFK